MTNVDALKILYVAFGGNVDDISSATTNVEVLNAIATKFEGTGTALTISDAINNIAEVAGAISKSGIALEVATVTPTKTKQTLVPSEGSDGFGTVTVNGVTAGIDSNITAGNIKNGVTILGVTGTYTGA